MVMQSLATSSNADCNRLAVLTFTDLWCTLQVCCEEEEEEEAGSSSEEPEDEDSPLEDDDSDDGKAPTPKKFKCPGSIPNPQLRQLSAPSGAEIAGPAG